MKPIEGVIENYVKFNKKHVIYRVTPVYKGDNKLASGVHLEAYSIEDQGKGVCYNVYLYNVQPGIDLDYTSGENRQADAIAGTDGVLPFAVYNANDNNPDLILEMEKHLTVLFDNPKSEGTLNKMKGEINKIANEARAIGNRGKSRAQCYIKMKEVQYKYFGVLKAYVPLLLQKEEFFTKAFEAP